MAAPGEQPTLPVVPATGDPSAPAPVDIGTPSAPGTPRAGRRRAKPKRRHTVATVVGAAMLALGLVTALGVVYEYRHLSGNLTVVDVTDDIVGERPDVVEVEGPKQPINLLIMGSDSRDCEGCNIDNLTGDGQRSDTTIFVHLSADREHAYGVSIPRDSMVDRPVCKSDGTVYPAASYQMWNTAFSLGGPACTISQFEHETGIKIDHYIVVNFEGFKGMVDAVGGVEVCIPETIDDRAHGIYLEAGTRKLEGQQALNYVRERYAVSGGSDIGRMKRQQAFIASMASAVLSANTLANPLRLVSFLDAATKSLTLDPGLGSLKKIAGLGYEFRGIGLDKVQFLTVPNGVDPNDPNRLVWLPSAQQVWDRLRSDQPLTKQLSAEAISAARVPGVTTSPDPSSGEDDTPTKNGDGTPSAQPSTSPEQAEQLRAAGLCA